MILRLAKTVLVFSIALYTTLIALDNLTDYDSNYQFVRHVLMMDSTFPDNHAMWRAINSPVIHSLFYWMIIVWELLSSAVCWCGGVRLARSIAKPAGEFHRAKGLAVAGLTFSLLVWLVAFLTVGEGWFLMWQSRTANGQEAAFRMFAIVGIVLLLLAQPDVD
jgi:predicted small integral membrane protein